MAENINSKTVSTALKALNKVLAVQQKDLELLISKNPTGAAHDTLVSANGLITSAAKNINDAIENLKSA